MDARKSTQWWGIREAMERVAPGASRTAHRDATDRLLQDIHDHQPAAACVSSEVTGARRGFAEGRQP